MESNNSDRENVRALVVFPPETQPEASGSFLGQPFIPKLNKTSQVGGLLNFRAGVCFRSSEIGPEQTMLTAPSGWDSSKDYRHARKSLKFFYDFYSRRLHGVLPPPHDAELNLVGDTESGSGRLQRFRDSESGSPVRLHSSLKVYLNVHTMSCKCFCPGKTAERKSALPSRIR